MTATARITFDTLESQAFNNLYTILNTRTNIPDPRDNLNLGSRRFVYDFDPFETRIDFNLLPYIVVSLPTMVYDKATADGTKRFITWSHKITVRTAIRGVSNYNDELGRTDILTIGDSLNKLFNSWNSIATFRSYRMQKIVFKKDDVDTLTVDGKDVYEAVYSIEYETLMDVTA